jgi:hypothetical protein
MKGLTIVIIAPIYLAQPLFYFTHTHNEMKMCMNVKKERKFTALNRCQSTPPPRYQYDCHIYIYLLGKMKIRRKEKYNEAHRKFTTMVADRHICLSSAWEKHSATGSSHAYH